MSYDIVIIGAGPAGCTLARILDRGYKVLLLDKRDVTTNNYNSKCCGGLLAPDAQKMLGSLGMTVPTSLLVDPQLFLVRTMDFDNQIERYYQRFYFNMDRLAFEQWLLSNVPNTVDLALGCTFKSCKATPNGVQFTLTHNGKTYEENTRLIIGADGGNSMVRKSLFPDKKTPDNYVAIQEWFETETQLPWYGAIFDSTITDFYSWTITKGNVLMIGSALRKNNLALDRFKMLKMKLRDRGLTYGKKITREGAFIYRPRHTSSIITGDKYCALVGEAAGFISPSSAEGISFAMQSAYYLGNALNEGIGGYHKDYTKNVSKLKRSIYLKNLKCPAMYNKFLRGLILKSGIQSTETYF